MESGFQKELFSSLISDIKNYNGDDPLRPWLRGIRKMRESLAPNTLKEKLPRFLQKCAQTFESDRRYRNDSRYLRVWIELMDYVDDARVLLRKMEKNHIGLKRAMFYSAYALYYEKRKRFEDAEKMYHIGVKNLAEPAAELQKSYEQFLHRMMLLKKRKTKLQEAMPNNVRSEIVAFKQAKTKVTGKNKRDEGATSQISLPNTKTGDNDKNVEDVHLKEEFSETVEGGCKGPANCKHMSCPPSCNKHDLAKKNSEHGHNDIMKLDKQISISSDDTIVVKKFVGSAIVGKSEAEDACHHGLVDPTINMREAMNAISSMFREPLDIDSMAKRRSNRSKPNESQKSKGFEVFVDESSEERMQPNHPKFMNPDLPKNQMKTELQKPFVGAFKIWTEDDNGSSDEDDKCCDEDGMEIEEHTQGTKLKPNGQNPSSRDEANTMKFEDVRMKEDTVIRRFVGSTVFGEPEVESACHHGLVDPTINLKEAMDDINSMFGKPMNFIRARRSKSQAKLLEAKPASHGFSVLADNDSAEDSISCLDDINSMFGKPVDFVKANRLKMQAKPESDGFYILADDNLEDNSKGQASRSIPSKLSGEGNLFEPTVFTREAMADINEMFGKTLDF